MFLRDLFHFLPRSPLRRALGAMNRGEFQSAAALLEGLLAGDPADDLRSYAGEAYIQWGKQCRDAGDLHAALRCFERAATFRPNFADVQVLLAQLYEHVDRPQAARLAYERAIALNPRYFDARLGLARLLAHAGETDLALRHLQEAAQYAPPQSRRQWGERLAGAANADPDRVREQLQELTASIPAAPSSAVAAGIEAARRAMRIGENSRAIVELKALVASSPAYPDLHNLLGIAYDNEAMLDDAVEEFERAVALNPDYAEARLNLGLALFHRGRHEEATRHLRWIESRHPGHEIVRTVLEQIEAPRQQALSAQP